MKNTFDSAVRYAAERTKRIDETEYATQIHQAECRAPVNRFLDLHCQGCLTILRQRVGRKGKG